LKKQEAIIVDIAAHEDRLGKIRVLAKTLDTENYHSKESTNAKTKDINERWIKLNEDIFDQRRKLLNDLQFQQSILFYKK